MNKRHFFSTIIFMICILLVNKAISCPTCIGKLDRRSHAFFAKEYYEYDPAQDTFENPEDGNDIDEDNDEPEEDN
jgi:hypothetical protein